MLPKSDVTKIAPSEILCYAYILFIKSPESLIYDLHSCITGLRWWSKNSDAFSVGVPQFGLGVPTFAKCLCILGRR